MLTVEFSQTHQRPYWHSPERGVFWETPTATADTAEAYGDAVDRDRARARFATLDSRPRGPGISSVFWVRGFRKCCACPDTRGLRLRSYCLSRKHRRCAWKGSRRRHPSPFAPLRIWDTEA